MCKTALLAAVPVIGLLAFCDHAASNQRASTPPTSKPHRALRVTTFHVLRIGGITIEYPPGLERQARRLAKTALRVLPKRFNELDQDVARLVKPETADQICEMLGVPEEREWLRKLPTDWCRVSQLSAPLFRRVRVYQLP